MNRYRRGSPVSEGDGQKINCVWDQSKIKEDIKVPIQLIVSLLTIEQSIPLIRLLVNNQLYT